MIRDKIMGSNTLKLAKGLSPECESGGDSSGIAANKIITIMIALR